MKKTLALELAVVLVLVTALPVFAAEPRWANIVSIVPRLLLADDMYISEIVGMDGTTKITCQMILYERDVYGDYNEVDRSTKQTVYAPDALFQKGYDLNSGTSYRLVTNVDVTRNGTTESVSYTFDKRL